MITTSPQILDDELYDQFDNHKPLGARRRSAMPVASQLSAVRSSRKTSRGRQAQHRVSRTKSGSHHRRQRKAFAQLTAL